MRRFAPLLVAMCLVAGSCGDDTPSGEPAPSSTSAAPSNDTAATDSDNPETAMTDAHPTASVEDFPSPPQLQVLGGEESVSLNAFTYCWPTGDDATVCADGIPPEDPPLLQVIEPIMFLWPIPNWQFSVTSGSEDCPRRSVTIGPDEVFEPFDCDVLDVLAFGDGSDAAFRFQIENSLPAVVQGAEFAWSLSTGGERPSNATIATMTITGFADEIGSIEGEFTVSPEADAVFSGPIDVEVTEDTVVVSSSVDFDDVDPPPIIMTFVLFINGVLYDHPAVWPAHFDAEGNGPQGSLIPQG